jgi:nitrogen fixation NifU-like protein
MNYPEPQLDDLYRELILDHYRHPRNRGTLAHASAKVDGYNPLCGDEVELELLFDDEGVIEDVAFKGRGCSISQASTSMMTELIKGHDKAEAQHLVDAFKRMMTAPEDEPPAELGDLRRSRAWRSSRYGSSAPRWPGTSWSRGCATAARRTSKKPDRIEWNASEELDDSEHDCDTRGSHGAAEADSGPGDPPGHS